MTMLAKTSSVTGMQLSRRFYWQAVRPLLDAHYPGLAHAAALLGNGSEVLGYDDVTSTDHHWGPRVLLFVQPADYDPRYVWLYLLAAAWARIGQEEHLMGRAGQIGDELGSALIGARLVRDVMRLCFLMERTYAPYAKWFGTAFRRLDGGAQLYPILQATLAAPVWPQREEQLCLAYSELARRHNQLQITPSMPEQPRQFFGRPLRVMALHGFADALASQIADQQLKVLAARRPFGSLDLFSDNVDLVADVQLRPILRQLYTSERCGIEF